MPLERLVLIIVIVLAAAGLTVLAGAFILSAFALPSWATIGAAIPVALVLYIVIRAIGERLSSREDDHYDEIDH
jgi:membrane protein implicated in regulation of membrane protease activity